MNQKDIEILKKIRLDIISSLLGLEISEKSSDADKLSTVMNLIIDIRLKARANKDWSTSDYIRDNLSEAGIKLKDSKTGTDWEID